jgi:large subunit ribosomal protein L4
MPTVEILGAKGVAAGRLELKPEVFGVEVRGPLLHQAVTRELNARRVGTHDTKGRSEVSGGGRKPWRQKGTGRARQGSIRATQWKGGGKPFGPTPRSYAQALPRQMRREALRAAVAATIAAGHLKVVEEVEPADGRTKTLVGWLAGLGLAPVATVLVMRAPGALLMRAGRNVAWLTLQTSAQVSVYQLLRARQVVFERGALLGLQEALSSEGGGAPLPGSIVGGGPAAPAESVVGGGPAAAAEAPRKERAGRARARKAAADQAEVVEP